MNKCLYLYNMKSAKVLKLLHVSRATLVKYVKNKEIRVVELSNGFYEYNDEYVQSPPQAQT